MSRTAGWVVGVRESSGIARALYLAADENFGDLTTHGWNLVNRDFQSRDAAQTEANDRNAKSGVTL